MSTATSRYGHFALFFFSVVATSFLHPLTLSCLQHMTCQGPLLLLLFRCTGMTDTGDVGWGLVASSTPVCSLLCALIQLNLPVSPRIHEQSHKLKGQENAPYPVPCLMAHELFLNSNCATATPPITRLGVPLSPSKKIPSLISSPYPSVSHLRSTECFCTSTLQLPQ